MHAERSDARQNRDVGPRPRTRSFNAVKSRPRGEFARQASPIVRHGSGLANRTSATRGAMGSPALTASCGTSVTPCPALASWTPVARRCQSSSADASRGLFVECGLHGIAQRRARLGIRRLMTGRKATRLARRGRTHLILFCLPVLPKPAVCIKVTSTRPFIL